jgi:hypothetical protein
LGNTFGKNGNVNRFRRAEMTNLATLTKKIVAAHIAKVDGMTGEELLDYVNQPVMPWEERNVNGPLMTVRRHAFARLESLTK